MNKTHEHLFYKLEKVSNKNDIDLVFKELNINNESSILRLLKLYLTLKYNLHVSKYKNIDALKNFISKNK